MQPTFLAVDDQDNVRTALRSWIALHYPKSRFLEATTGEEALALVGDHRPDIVLMDISLPGMNGIEATRRIKAAMPQAQIVIVTLYGALQYRRDAAAAGASAYVVKSRLGVELMPVLMRLLSNRVSPEDIELRKTL